MSDVVVMTTPRTAAGRKHEDYCRTFMGDDAAKEVLAIEAEATAAEHERAVDACAQLVIAAKAEARAPYTDPQDRWRLVLVQPDVLAQWGTRTEDGDRLTVEWGEPDDDGIYDPTFTRHGDDNLRTAALDEARAAADSALWDLEGPDASHPGIRVEYRRRVMAAIDALRERSGE